jgi:hypothetical protein
LRELADTLRAGAEAIGPTPSALPTLSEVEQRLRAELLPHQREEERALYPAAAQRLGGLDPMAPLLRMHAEIESLAERVGVLLSLAAAEGDWASVGPELRRTLFGLEALLRLHLTAEEEMLASLSGEAPPSPSPAMRGRVGEGATA